ncbi:MAG: ABC transporter ATP-binding protein [Geminicoccaceae bacterium]
MAALLAAEHIARSFGGVHAVVDTSLVVEKGTITGLIGPNGAGKTTLFNILSGTLRPDAGRVLFDGHDITSASPDRVARSGLTRSFQIARGFPTLTVLESLMLYAPEQVGDDLACALFRPGKWRAQDRDVAARAGEIASMLKLDLHLDNLTTALSGGQKKLLEIGRALMAEPKLILLDEPVAGINPSLARDIADILLDLRRAGYSFLVIEHDMGTVATICDPVVVMAQGRDLMRGSFAEIAADRRVQDAYLGHVAS